MSMTSTPFNVGLAGDGARNSSRVLRPPGGGHTDIFGGEAEPTRGRRQGYAQPPSSIGEQAQHDSQPEQGRGRRQGYPQAANNFGEETIIKDEQARSLCEPDQHIKDTWLEQQVKGKRHFAQPQDSIYERPMSVSWMADPTPGKRHGYTQTVDAIYERPPGPAEFWSAEPDHGKRHGYIQPVDSVYELATGSTPEPTTGKFHGSSQTEYKPAAGDVAPHDMDRRHYEEPRDAIYERPPAEFWSAEPDHGKRHGYIQPVDSVYELAAGSTPEPTTGKFHGSSQTEYKPAAGDVAPHDMDRRHYEEPRDAIYERPPAEFWNAEPDHGKRHGYIQLVDSINERAAGSTPEPTSGKFHGSSQTEYKPAAGDVAPHDMDRRHYEEPRDAIYERPPAEFWSAEPDHGKRHGYIQPVDSINERAAGSTPEPTTGKFHGSSQTEYKPAAGDVAPHDMDRRHYEEPRDAIYERPPAEFWSAEPDHGKRHGYIQPVDSINERAAGSTPEPTTGKFHGSSQTEYKPAAGDVAPHDMDRRHYEEPRDAIYERPPAKFWSAEPDHGKRHGYIQPMDSVYELAKKSDPKPSTGVCQTEYRPAAGHVTQHDMDRRHYDQPRDAFYEQEHRGLSLCQRMAAAQCQSSICGQGAAGPERRGRKQFAHVASTICDQPVAEPPRGKRPGPTQPPTSIGQGDEPKPKNGIEVSNGALTPEQASAPDSTPEAVAAPAPEPAAAAPSPTKPEPTQPERAEPAKRVRVPPGGFSSGLCPVGRGAPMEGAGRRLSRLLNKLRGDRKCALEKGISFTSTAMSESTGCGSNDNEAPEANEEYGYGRERDETDLSQDGASLPRATSCIDDDQFAANIDLRYGGQYLTPDQLPVFCEQLHHLVEVVRNIQSYGKVTGEYPTELERRLEHEAREVAALAAETRNARDVVARTRVQRRALRDHRVQLERQLTSLRDTEVRELESAVRLSDRKLFKTWEALKESADPAAFQPLLDDIRNKQSALACLLRLIETRAQPSAHPLPPPSSTIPPPAHRPAPADTHEMLAEGARARDPRRNKRRRREPRSVPLSGRPSVLTPPPPTQVRLYIQGAEPTLPVLELPSGGSVRDILFFTANTS